MGVKKAIATLAGTGATTMLGAALGDKATFAGNFAFIFWLGALFFSTGVGLGFFGRSAS